MANLRGRWCVRVGGRLTVMCRTAAAARVRPGERNDTISSGAPMSEGGEGEGKDEGEGEGYQIRFDPQPTCKQKVHILNCYQNFIQRCAV